MRTIHKFKLDLDTNLELPSGARFLDVQTQGPDVVAWFLLETLDAKEIRKFSIFGTGQEVPGHMTYRGTFQKPPFVWHLFENMR